MASNTAESYLVKITEAARLLSLSERTIARLVAKGKLVAVGRHKLRRITRQSLEQYVMQQNTQGHSNGAA